jgi:hypothetical protein
MLGAYFGCYSTYYTPMLNGYGLSNSLIELLLLGTATGGFLSGFLSDLLLKFINKETLYLNSAISSCGVNFFLGFIIYFDSIMDNRILVASSLLLFACF